MKNAIARVAGLFIVVISAASASGQESPATISGGTVKIGVVTDLSGVNIDYGGPSAVIAAQMAADEFGGKVLGKPIEIFWRLTIKTSPTSPRRRCANGSTRTVWIW